MNCPTISENLIPYIKGELNPAEARLIEEHLLACARCRGEERALRVALAEMAGLPVFPISVDAAAMRLAGERRAWWRAPAAACAVLLVVLALSVLIRRENTPVVNVPKPPPQRIALPGTERLPVPPPVIVNIPAQRAIPRPPRERKVSHRPHPRVEKPPTPRAEQPVEENVIAKYVDTIAMCMAQAGGRRSSISCSVLPVAAADERDLPVADTLTATLVCAFAERNVTMQVNRLSPLEAEEARNALKHPTSGDENTPDDYLVIASIEKGKSGYLLSLYAVNKHDERVVFNGDHPILLPEEMLPRRS